jgi:hypothetical protein
LNGYSNRYRELQQSKKIETAHRTLPLGKDITKKELVDIKFSGSGEDLTPLIIYGK